ncbi:ATP-dependent DNA ligase [Microbacterium caowuchunii]|uniref:DUF7882 family protein n=1 Tax=Microbacterium caowuchunii TaxID=2614638 RepID=UPI001247D9B9|nr:ATP-dependent DNA ligase [Microbacterium caowuchunii]QEW00753.1 ATP-dependent DNA ligase [Microbacterium caowuchunii]
MGRFIYNTGEFSIPIDDRPLAHFRIVFMTKLRRGEPFMFQVPDPTGVGTRSLWVDPAVPVTFAFSGARTPALDMEWIDELMHEASSANGLTFALEPARRGESLPKGRRGDPALRGASTSAHARA